LREKAALNKGWQYWPLGEKGGCSHKKKEKKNQKKKKHPQKKKNTKKKQKKKNPNKKTKKKKKKKKNTHNTTHTNVSRRTRNWAERMLLTRKRKKSQTISQGNKNGDG